MHPEHCSTYSVVIPLTDNVLFQQDNACSHNTHATQHVLQQLPWMGYDGMMPKLFS